MELYLVPTDRLQSIWGEVVSYIDSYVERSFGRYDTSDVFNALENGTFQLWVALEEDKVKAAAMTQVFAFPKLTEMQIVMCSGLEHGNWFSLIKKIEEYAKEIGATKMVGVSRLGWKKIMTEAGYKNTHIYLEKDL